MKKNKSKKTSKANSKLKDNPSLRKLSCSSNCQCCLIIERNNESFYAYFESPSHFVMAEKYRQNNKIEKIDPIKLDYECNLALTMKSNSYMVIPIPCISEKKSLSNERDSLIEMKDLIKDR